MADYGADASDGKWLRYGLSPGDIAVHAGRTPDDGLSVTWEGRADPEDLINFFRGATERLSVPWGGYFRSWFMTRENLASSNSPPWDLDRASRDMLAAASYIRLECLLAPPNSDDDVGHPILAVFANIARGATNYDDMEAADQDDSGESVGVYLLRSGDLPAMTDCIAGLASSTTPHGFPDRHAYRPRTVRDRLSEAVADLRSEWSRGPIMRRSAS